MKLRLLGSFNKEHKEMKDESNQDWSQDIHYPKTVNETGLPRLLLAGNHIARCDF